MKKNNAIVFTVSSNLTFAVACVILNMKKVSPKLADEIVIIHDGIREKDQKLLCSIFPSRFILYDFPIKDTSIFNKGTLSYFTKMVFAKFECLKLLNDYKNVMLLDSDIVIKQEISELFTFCESAIKMMPGGIKIKEQLNQSVDDYEMNIEGIAAGIFVFQDHLVDYMKMYNFCYESLSKYASSLYMPEQAIFDFMIQEFNLEICPIDSKIYAPHPNNEELADNAKIIHSYGQPKFWNGINNNQWIQNYETWIKMGGSRYKKVPIIKKVLLKLKHMLNKYLKQYE